MSFLPPHPVAEKSRSLTKTRRGKSRATKCVWWAVHHHQTEPNLACLPAAAQLPLASWDLHIGEAKSGRDREQKKKKRKRRGGVWVRLQQGSK
jgi:hypothetical protein